MTFRPDEAHPGDVEADVLVLGVTCDDADAQVQVTDPGRAIGQRLGIDLVDACRAVDMDGTVGSCAIVPAGDAVTAALLVLVGLGRSDAVDADGVRAASATAVRVASRRDRLATTLHTVDIGDPALAARAVVEGTELGHYVFRDFKTGDDARALTEVVLVGGDRDAVEVGTARGRISADATMLARDLGNTPAGDKRPPAFADRVVELFADLPVEVEVWDQARIEAAGFGGHLAVAAGSAVEPRFVQLRYRPDDATRHVALVGKGITFDSGGLSLKTPKGMEWMKIDMAGAASVLATVRAAATAEVPVALTGMLCLAENMPSGSATRPGDVITMYDGTTVEVLNTDAEGRLVMADALGWSAELDPPVDELVDIATLTGAAIHALGPRYTVVMANDDALAESLLAASAVSAEPMWRLPLAEAEYGTDVVSDVADVRNTGGTGAGTIRAALFLQTFVPDGQSWAHLDIAGPAFNDESVYGGYVPKQATGIPVRTLLDWLWD
nr:leucyl aminopeptidase [Salsipaludibacter albus]